MRITSGLMVWLCVSFLALGPGSSTAAAKAIEHQMSAADFAEAGLTKLTPQELQALNEWLAAHREGFQGSSLSDSQAKPEPETAKAEENFGLSDSQIRAAAPKSRQRERIQSRIDGDFSGWTGKTRFKLENGQVWQQRNGGSYYHRADNPEVEVFRNRLGFYMLKVVETKRAIGVRRLQ